LDSFLALDFELTPGGLLVKIHTVDDSQCCLSQGTWQPRSIYTFMTVLDERQAQGIEDDLGPEASPLPADMNRDEYGAKVRAQLAGW